MKFAKPYLIVLAIVLLLSQLAWSFEIDFSRRRKASPTTSTQTVEIPLGEVKSVPVSPTYAPKPKEDEGFKSVFDLFSNPSEPKQEFVILNTDKGFIPSRVSLRKGGYYRIHVVNVNEKEKNVSFILDAFSEFHSTYFGKTVSFEVKPQQEGVFSFQCPETSQEGKLVVFSPPSQGVSPQDRGLATEGN